MSWGTRRPFAMPVFSKCYCFFGGGGGLKQKCLILSGALHFNCRILVGNKAQSTKRYRKKLHNIVFFCHHHFTRGAGVCASCLGVKVRSHPGWAASSSQGLLGWQTAIHTHTHTHTRTIRKMSFSFLRFHMQDWKTLPHWRSSYFPTESGNACLGMVA